MVDSYEFARRKKHVLTASRVDPPRIDDIELDGEFVRFDVPADEAWLGAEYDSLDAVPPNEVQSMLARPVKAVVSWYERLVADVLDDHHLHVDVLDLDGEPAFEVRCKYEWAIQHVDGQRTEASFVKLLVQTLGPAGTNEADDAASSPWHDVEAVPPDLRASDLE